MVVVEFVVVLWWFMWWFLWCFCGFFCGGFCGGYLGVFYDGLCVVVGDKVVCGDKG